MNTPIRCGLWLGLLLAGGCEEPAEDMDDAADAAGAMGKADGIGGAARVTWSALSSSGCSASRVSNDPSGNGYASSWLFQHPAVQRCSLSGSATFPAGVAVQRMNVSGEGYIAAAHPDAIPSVAVDIRGSSNQAILQGSTLLQAPGGEDNVLFMGVETLPTGCLTAPATFRFRTDFAVGADTVAQFETLDVQFDVEPCGG